MNMIEKIEKMMVDRSLTKADISKGANIPYTTVDGIFKKGYENMKLPTLQKLAKFFDISMEYLINDDMDKDEINIPKSYSDQFKVTSRDKKQYLIEMKKANEAFFHDDEMNEDAKKEMLDLMSELFWEAKKLNKRKPKDKDK